MQKPVDPQKLTNDLQETFGHGAAELVHDVDSPTSCQVYLRVTAPRAEASPPDDQLRRAWATFHLQQQADGWHVERLSPALPLCGVLQSLGIAHVSLAPEWVGADYVQEMFQLLGRQVQVASRDACRFRWMAHTKVSLHYMPGAADQGTPGEWRVVDLDGTVLAGGRTIPAALDAAFQAWSLRHQSAKVASLWPALLAE